MSKFKVKVERERNLKDDKFILLTTANGYQWSGGSALTILNIIEIRDCLDDFIYKQHQNLDNNKVDNNR